MSIEWKDALSVINKLAPTIAAALGGPLAAGGVVALQKVFGLDGQGGSEGDSKDQLAAAISGATADQLLALKLADQNYAIKMQELGFKNIAELETLAAGDRDSARKREIEVKDSTPRNLAYAITIGFFGILLLLMFGDIPTSSREVLYIMLGTLGTAWTGCISYYFGSTSSSSEKNKLLAASTPKKD